MMSLSVKLISSESRAFRRCPIVLMSTVHNVWLSRIRNNYKHHLSHSVIFVNENENGEKRENNEFVNEN